MNQPNEFPRPNQFARRWIAPLLVLILGAIAYSNSENGPFIFDDVAAIQRNPQIRSLDSLFHPSTNTTTISGRPIAIFSFALDYAIGGLRVQIYHETNVLIHLLCALVLYEVTRRTLLRINVSTSEAIWLAAAIASLWVVHPLTTQAVTYIVQRAESLASLFILLTILCLIFASGGKWWWGVLTVLCCALGMLSKEIAVVTPILALLFDRAFLAGSFRRALRNRWGIYLGLALTWGLLALLIPGSGQRHMASFHVGISARQYAQTQMNVIAHYVRLALWPTNLSLDYYDWPIATTAADITWRGRLVMLAICGWIAALRYRPRPAFVMAWFFLILAPSSSILPIKNEAAAEYRMYLPLAAIAGLVVFAAWTAVRPRRPLRLFAAAAYCAALATLICLTIQRNQQYHSALEIWTDTVAKRPANPRARFNLGESYAQQSLDLPAGSPEELAAVREAAEQFKMVLALEPQDSDAVYAIAQSLERAGDLTGAEQVYTDAIARYPAITANLLVERGNLCARNQNWAGARQDFLDAIDAKPNDVEPHYFLGLLYLTVGDRADAIAELRKAAAINPNYKDVTPLLARLSSPGSQPALRLRIDIRRRLDLRDDRRHPLGIVSRVKRPLQKRRPQRIDQHPVAALLLHPGLADSYLRPVRDAFHFHESRPAILHHPRPGRIIADKTPRNRRIGVAWAVRLHPRHRRPENPDMHQLPRLRIAHQRNVRIPRFIVRHIRLRELLRELMLLI